jgi:class 3 adenylate cyclase
VLDANTTLTTVRQESYSCSLCAAGYEPTLDEMVEVTFTVNPRVRRIAAHTPQELPHNQYYRQVFWGSGFDVPDESLDRLIEEICLDFLELPPREKAVLSLQLPSEFVIVFEPVTHAAQFLDVKGEPSGERQKLDFVFNEMHAIHATRPMKPGPVRLAFENRTDKRLLPGVWIAGNKLHDLLGRRRPFLTAQRLLTSQTFRDIYRTGTLDVDQRLRITSLTFLFTDLKGSTQLYDRVGDLVAFDLVRAHFRVLRDIVASEAGAVVRTLGDAVMATFPTPDRALASALRMREAVEQLGGEYGDLLLKIGIHEGPCLAVMLDDRQDYFGHTVNIASRIQGLATTRSIWASEKIVKHPRSSKLLEEMGVDPIARSCMLAGVGEAMEVYEIA